MQQLLSNQKSSAAYVVVVKECEDYDAKRPFNRKFSAFGPSIN